MIGEVAELVKGMTLSGALIKTEDEKEAGMVKENGVSVEKSFCEKLNGFSVSCSSSGSRLPTGKK